MYMSKFPFIYIPTDLDGTMNTCTTSVFKDLYDAKHPFYINDKYAVVPIDRVPFNIVFVCKSH